MAPSSFNRKSVPVPSRMTLDLISDTFQVMLENMGMTEACIVQYMTSLKGFQATQIVQLRQALKMAVDMGLVTFRGGRYMFTIDNLENLIAHKNDCKNPGKSVVSEYLRSAPAKRRLSQRPTPTSKRLRTCRSHFKPLTSPVSRPRRKRPRPPNKKTPPCGRVGRRKAVRLDEAGPSSPLKMRNRRGVKRTTMTQASCNDNELEYFVPKVKRRKSTASVTSKHSLESVVTAKTGSSVRTVCSSTRSKKSRSPSETSRKSEEAVEVYRKRKVVPRDRRLRTASMLNEYLETTSFRKSQRGDRGSGASSAAGSKAGSNLSKTPSATSSITNGTDDDKKAGSGKKPTSTLASSLRKSFVKKLEPKPSGSSVESGSSNGRRGRSKTSVNTDDEAKMATATPSKSSNASSWKTAESGERGQTDSVDQTSGVKPRNSDSSLGSKGSNVSKPSSRTSVNTNETAESARSTRTKKPEGDSATLRKPTGSKPQESENSKSTTASPALGNTAGDVGPCAAASTSTSFTRSVVLRGAATPTVTETRDAGRARRRGATSTEGAGRRGGRRHRSATRFVGNNADKEDEEPDTRALHDFYT